MKFALDSNRKIDSNGFLHVALSNISKECVNPYYGYEIPNFEMLGLEKNKIYYAYRRADELEKAAHTFNGLPLLRGHYIEHAKNPQKEHRVGSLGTECVFNMPYLQNSLIVTDEEAIKKIETGERVELSAAYAYVPVFESGSFEGQNYDFIMTQIKGNHVALVEEGRAGPDIVVSDEKISTEAKKETIDSDELEMKNSSDIVKFSKENKGNSLEVFKSEQAENEDEKESKLTRIQKILDKSYKEIYSIISDAFTENVNNNNELSKKRRVSTEVNQEEKNLVSSKSMPVNNSVANDYIVLDQLPEIELKNKIHENLKQMNEAMKLCLPFTGEIDILAFDNSNDIFVHACKLINVPASKESARDVIMALLGNENNEFIQENSSCFKSRFV